MTLLAFVTAFVDVDVDVDADALAVVEVLLPPVLSVTADFGLNANERHCSGVGNGELSSAALSELCLNSARLRPTYTSVTVCNGTQEERILGNGGDARDRGASLKKREP